MRLIFNLGVSCFRLAHFVVVVVFLLLLLLLLLLLFFWGGGGGGCTGLFSGLCLSIIYFFYLLLFARISPTIIFARSLGSLDDGLMNTFL